MTGTTFMLFSNGVDMSKGAKKAKPVLFLEAAAKHAGYDATEFRALMKRIVEEDGRIVDHEISGFTDTADLNAFYNANEEMVWYSVKRYADHAEIGVQDFLGSCVIEDVNDFKEVMVYMALSHAARTHA